MDKIPSFTIDHLRLERGVFVSRKDHFGPTTLTTFDVRMKAPNREPVLEQGAIHTIEHLAATYLRNDPEWSSRIVYWGPMGCLTGNYLIVEGDCTSEQLVPVLRKTFDFIANYTGEVPGATEKDCGNCHLHDLEGARKEAKKYLDEVLTNPKPENLNYPQ